MGLKEHLGLRPKSRTAADIAAALDAARAAHGEAAERLATLAAARGETLLDGSAADVARSEAAYAAARDEADRAGAVIAPLEARLAAAERAEELAEVERLRDDAHQQREAFLAWARQEYVALAARLVEGARMEVAALDAMRTAHQRAITAAARHGVPAFRMPPDPMAELYPDAANALWRFADILRLPAAPGPGTELPELWPAAAPRVRL